MGVSGGRARGSRGRRETLSLVLMRTHVITTCERDLGHSGQASWGGLGV